MATRRLGSLLVACVLVAAFGVSPARAGCIGPSVSVELTTVRVDASITIHGEYWTDECNDTISCSGGCGGNDECVGGEPERRLQSITVLIRPTSGRVGTRVVLVESVAVAPDLTFDVRAVIPPQTTPGRYRLVARNDRVGVIRGPLIEVLA